MADPTPYVPSYSYSGWQQNNPTRPLPADEVDNDFAKLRITTSELIQGLREVRRSDGKLQNQIVTADSLAPQLSLGFGFKGAWAAGTSYSTGDGVVYENAFYRADSQHTSVADAPPGDGGPWTFLFSIDDIVVAGALAMPVDTFTGDGSTAGFNLSFTPRSANNLIVSVGGVVQNVVEYSVNGNTITFDDPPAAGYAIEVRGFATTATIVTPADGSVTEVKLGSALADKINSALQPDDIGDTVGDMTEAVYDPANKASQVLVEDDAQDPKFPAPFRVFSLQELLQGQFNFAKFVNPSLYDGSQDVLPGLQEYITEARAIIEEPAAGNIAFVSDFIKIPSGQWQIDGTLELFTGLDVGGASAMSTSLVHTGGGAAAVSIKRIGSENAAWVRLHDLFIKGAGNTVGGTLRGFENVEQPFNAVRLSALSRVEIDNCYDGVYMDNAFGFTIEDCYLRLAGRNNIRWLNATAGLIKGGRIETADEDNIYMTGGTPFPSAPTTVLETIAFTMIQTVNQSAGGRGFYGVDLNNTNFYATYWEANNRLGLNAPDIELVDGPDARGDIHNWNGNWHSPGSRPLRDYVIRVERAVQLNIDSIFARGSGGYDNGIGYGANVQAGRLTGRMQTGTPYFVFEGAQPRLFVHINNDIPIFHGAGGVTADGNGNNMQLRVGEQGAGDVSIGSIDNLPAIQGGGTGSNLDLNINPVAGITRARAPRYYQTESGSNVTVARDGGDAIVSTAAGNRQVTLPAISGIGGREIVVAKRTTDANTLTILPNGTDTIEGAANLVLPGGARAAVILRAVTTGEWIVVARS